MIPQNQFLIFIVGLFVLCESLCAEPIVINGAMVPMIIGKPIHALRVLNNEGNVIPFQIDEVTLDDEYVCFEGVEANRDSSDGEFDENDEIVFLWDDCTDGAMSILENAYSVEVSKNGLVRNVLLVVDSTRKLSDKKYIEYDHETRLLKTPWYYAQFAKERFHFVRAGVASFDSPSFFDLTSELSVEIKMRALFGLITIHYTEDNLVCFVKRWKVGPIRLIRRGDFHLNLGFGIKGSKAAVNQICYPQLVKVPVLLHIPVRFGTLFKDAYIEMAPVIRKNAIDFKFLVNDNNLAWDLNDTISQKDTIFPVLPCNTLMSVNDGSKGYGWILQTTIPSQSLSGSGIFLRIPSKRNGRADCGYHLAVDEVEKGYYDITNWVLFPRVNNGAFSVDYRFIVSPSVITTNAGTFNNLVCSIIPPQQKRKKR